MDPCDELSMHPGPKNPTLLHLQSSHRSSLVWEVGGGDIHRSRRRNPTQSRFPQLHSSMIPILEDLRFDGVARLSCINIDWSLMTALVERWRPETHTFHLPVGECTITLQDVHVLLGLRIDGDVVTGSTGGVNGGWRNLILQTFGQAPTLKQKEKDSELRGGRLMLSWLNSTFNVLPDNPSEDDVRHYTQSYLLQLIAGVLFTDHSGGQVHCMYIPLICDFERCRKLAWGAAVLAYLFRELCKSCRTGVEEVAGCILLLQLWAWTRLPFLAPIPRGPSLDNPIWRDRPGPYGMKWCSHLKFTDTSSHVLPTHRLSLDALALSHFDWQPYTDDVLAKLPDHCREGTDIWCYKGPLICFYIVEPHLPNRCMRQLGMFQEIPTNDEFSKELHEINLQGKQSNNWLSIHHHHIEHWNHRREHLIGISAHFGIGVSDDYYHWYTNSTRRFHTRIAGSHFYSLDMFDHIASIARGEINGSNEDIAHLCSYGRQLVQDSFNNGVFQDFPVEERREKETLKRAKPKKPGHKGGRGGVNAPQKNGVHVDEVPYDEPPNVGDDGIEFIDEVVENLQGGGSLHGNEHLQQPKVITQVNPRPLSGLPNWDLLPPGDFLRMSNDAVCYHSPERSIPNEPADNYHSPILSHPTFNLLSQSPPQPPVHRYQPHSMQQQQPMPQQMQPRVHQQPSPTSQVVQQSQILENQQEVPEGHNLRVRKSRHINCGTDGKKIPNVKPRSRKIPNLKRLRKKY